MTNPFKRASTTIIYLAVGGSILLLCSNVQPISAQISVKYTILPKATMISEDAPPGEIAKQSFNILDIGVNLPLYRRIDRETGSFTMIENALSFRSQSIEVDFPVGDDEYFPETLYGINNSVAMIKSLNPDWLLVGFFSTGIFTDFENVDGDHYYVEGGAIFAKKINEKLTLGLGPVFTYAFGNPLFIPAPFVKYTSQSGKIILDVKVPQHIILGYIMSEGFKAGLTFRSLYSNYSLGDDQALDPDGKSPSIVFSDLTMALESSIRILKPFFLDVALGTTIDRTFKVDDNKGHKLFDRGTENTIFFSVALKIGD